MHGLLHLGLLDRKDNIYAKQNHPSTLCLPFTFDLHHPFLSYKSMSYLKIRESNSTGISCRTFQYFAFGLNITCQRAHAPVLMRCTAVVCHDWRLTEALKKRKDRNLDQYFQLLNITKLCSFKEMLLTNWFAN